MTMNILAVGDVCGEPGLAFLDKNLKNYRKENGIDFVVVNADNLTDYFELDEDSRKDNVA